MFARDGDTDDEFIIDGEDEHEWQSEAKLYTALEVRPNCRLRLQTVEGETVRLSLTVARIACSDYNV